LFALEFIHFSFIYKSTWMASALVDDYSDPIETSLEDLEKSSGHSPSSSATTSQNEKDSPNKLTQEQIDRMERNKKRALEIKSQKERVAKV
jgi:hypothetical protein